MSKKITVAELREMPQEMLPPETVARVIGVAAGWIRAAAREHPDWLPFPFLVAGTRTLIPRLALIRWMEGNQASEEAAQ